MLREIPRTRQIAGEPRRRWFSSQEQDLYVWHGAGDEIVAFQLCYAKYRDEHAIYWRADGGFRHLRVDDGEASGLSAQTPILLQDGAFDRDTVLARFRLLAADLPRDVVDFVTDRLAAYPAQPPDSA